MSSGPPLDPDASPAVTVDLDTADLEDPRAAIARAADRLPAPESLGASAWVAARATPSDAARPGLLGRLLGRGRRPTGPDLAIACTALLSAGFVDVCADGATTTAYGRTPRAD